MADYRVENLAKIIVEYCLSVKPKDRVAVVGSTLSETLMLAVQREVLRAGGYPFLFPSFPGSQYIRFSESNDDQLDFVSPVMKMAFEEFECLASLDQCWSEPLYWPGRKAKPGTQILRKPFS